MIAHPIETAPHDRPVLVYGTAAWESLDHRADSRKLWLVAEYRPELSWDWETDQPISGWASVTCNPYVDYIIATHWAELPEI